MKRLVLAAALASTIAAPAFAQSTTTTTQEYYVVQDASTKKCTIVDKKRPRPRWFKLDRWPSSLAQKPKVA